MYKNSIDSFINDIRTLKSDMSVDYAEVSPGFKFSNTGRRGGIKYFYISLNQMITVLEDIKNNIQEFIPNARYVEGTWRDLFHTYLSDDVINAMSTVQTLPLFNLITKVIYQANTLSIQFEDKQMPLSVPYLDTAIAYLTSQKADESAYLDSISTGGSTFGSKISSPFPVSSPTFIPSSNSGTNTIYYGAPGTGKSYKIKNEIGRAKKITTVFHPDTQYADFVGSLKPKTGTNSAGDPIITYEFRPGPFTTAFIEAEKVKTTLTPVYLVIEEINRASAAAVFGELFQLLDRKTDGSSEYEIELSDPDMLEYINSRLPTTVTSLSLPPNLFLVATMNSSDQAVKPMDTAFKRRWSFEYIQIDYSKATAGQLPIPLSSGTTNIEWAKFAEIINQRLQNLGVPEDRLLGHRFLSDVELSTPKAATNSLCGKLFVYLWDDVLRHGRREVIFNTAEFGTFGALVNGFKNSRSVFCEELEEDLSSAVEASTPDVTTEDE
ncbi:AAA family ATPase [Vibrio parahaemolyticus]|uniref:McrB family protein n=2 Tax=Vibrio parahaemolyticus TaxID=670 RepID=UPI00111EE852|nr:AAA family ATPase [Vibrio parahaemolyticus]EGR3414118.1 type II restriction endonuclease subunit R [Vibrio parahaemolyticus]MBE4142944.1 AAA family ATPase [Vibrio parahaemolyticus]MDF4800617.1 AAA family ATPase [Vibrio parahaemolyticus]MDF4851239.1 AAA family ATPase [Vibrio parahaemolyticus]TOE18529.1 type II restriction endonuclease subunit R [Vibrio parahaemolyticus]